MRFIRANDGILHKPYLKPRFRDRSLVVVVKSSQILNAGKIREEIIRETLIIPTMGRIRVVNKF